MKKSLLKYKEKVFAILKKLDRGETITYKKLAQEVGLKNPRNVGWILRQNTDPDEVPCFKVVLSSGKLATGYKFGGQKGQKIRLQNEGVEIPR